MIAIHLLFSTALLVLMLVCGVFWGLYFAISRSYHLFTATELAKIARIIVKNLEVPMRNISLLCLTLMALSIVFYADRHTLSFWAMIASFISIAGALFITIAIEVPINRQVVTWTNENTPQNWEQLRNRWQFYNIVRTVLALGSFVLYAVAIVF